MLPLYIGEILTAYGYKTAIAYKTTTKIVVNVIDSVKYDIVHAEIRNSHNCRKCMRCYPLL